VFGAQRLEAQHLFDARQFVGETSDELLHVGLGFLLDNEADGRVVLQRNERMGKIDSNGFGGGIAGNAGQGELHLDVEVVVEELMGVGCGGVVF
jgi:hypothetical protein